ncbi:MAG: ABC transporter substrate-binding protein [Anaerolineales bacterium]
MLRKILLSGILILGLGAQTLAMAQTDPTPVPPPEDRVIRVWYADEMIVQDAETLLQTLAEQQTQFNQLTTEFSADIRLKPSRGDGSIVNTLIVAQPVASSAMPDLVLLDRRALVEGVRSGVLRPLTDWFPDELRTEIVASALALGQVDGTLYGIPYGLDVQHLIYNMDEIETPPAAYDDILQNPARFVLPAATRENLEASDMILAQYLAAGGRLVDTAGLPILDQEPLLDVLGFYESALALGVFNIDMLNYSVPADYLAQLVLDETPLMVTTARAQIQQRSPAHYGMAPLPTTNGEPLVILDGWLWALTTTDPEQQRGALAFVEYVLGIEAHADNSMAFGTVPSRERALRIWFDDAYAEQLLTWLDTSLIIPTEQRNNAAATQIQAAFEAVLSGTTASEATESVLSALSSSTN